MGNSASIRVSAPGAKAASSDIDRLHDKFIRLQKQGVKGFGIGVGAGVAVAGLHLLDRALSGVVDIMGQAVEGALADEESIAHLGASLKANVPHWDGNTAAIEKTILSEQRLGFTDDELRDSLSLLVASTKDVGKAQILQNTAMDLARFKKISLQDATVALTRVEGGQFRGLKALGIVLRDGATATEALAAVQAVAAGQAEDFANTNRGKLLASQIKVNEALERLGAKIMPVVVEVIGKLADAVDGLMGGLDAYTAKAPGVGSAQDVMNRSALNGISIFGDLAGFLGRELKKQQDQLVARTDAIKNHTDTMSERIGIAASVMRTDLSPALGGIADKIVIVDGKVIHFTQMLSDMNAQLRYAGNNPWIGTRPDSEGKAPPPTVIPPPHVVPKFAAGGIVTRPTFAMVGEKGPEAIVPLNGAGGLGGSFHVTLNIQGAWTPSQGAQFARDAWPWIAREARRVGAF